MTTESELAEALRRAGLRFVYHLARAGVEGLRAIASIVEELGSVGAHRSEGQDRPAIEKIDLE